MSLPEYAPTVSDQQPVGGVLQLENGKCLPSSHDNVKQRDNYIVLVGRVIAANIKCLRFLLDVTTPHTVSQKQYR